MHSQHFKIFILLQLVWSGCGGIGATPEASLGETPSEGPVGKTIQKNSEKFVRCGRDSVTVQTGSKQRIQLKFNIDAEGRVKKVLIDSMSSPDPDLHQCVLRVVKQLQFPAPKDQKPKTLTYPLIIKPE